jgi:hypothetical protein
MNRLLSCLIVVGLVAAISACDKRDWMPTPKTGAGEVKQKVEEPVGAVDKRSRISFIDAIGQGAGPILNGVERPGGES